MPEPETSHEVIEEADALFWNPPVVDELMVGIAPFFTDESFEIEDMTDEEWQVFVDALDECPFSSTRTSSPPGSVPDAHSTCSTRSIWSTNGGGSPNRRGSLLGRARGWLGRPATRKAGPVDPTTRTLPVDIETIDRVARLRDECRLVGHPLHQKQHNGDLWVAATAIRWAIPLVAHDGVFIGCPGLDLRTEIQAGP